MELKIFRDTLPQAGTSCTVKAELPLETEILISDYLPPVFKLVKCFAKPVVLQKQLQPGRLTLEGYLRCTVFYQGEDGAGLCQTEQKLPFTKQLEVPEFSFTSWMAMVEGQTEYLNCRAVNPHRIEVRGAYGLVVTIHTQDKQELITALADGGIEQKLQTLNAVREVKLLAGKAVVKGEVRAQCAWRAEGESSLQSQAASLPFNQVVDLEGVAEDCRCMCVLEPVGFALAEGEQEASGQLTASVMMHLHAWRPCQLQYVADAFSTQFETAVTPQELAAEDLACMLNETASSTASGPLPDADAQLRACFVSYGPAQVTPYRDGWAFTVRAVATAFAENSLAELESYEKTLELVFPLAVEAPPGAQFSPECWLSTENIQCSCTGGTLEVTVTARAEGAILCRSTHPGIGSIELGEPLTTPDPEIALRIYYAQAGEELFGIARRFHVSPAQILTANGLEAGTQVLPQAMRFLVPGA